MCLCATQPLPFLRDAGMLRLESQAREAPPDLVRHTNLGSADRIWGLPGLGSQEYRIKSCLFASFLLK